MGPRVFHSKKSGAALPDALQSLLAAELLAPSKQLWIVSPWISDIFVLENSSREFSSLVPEWELAPVRLAQYMAYLADRGTEIHIVTREIDQIRDFVIRMRVIASKQPHRVHIHIHNLVHEKGLLTDHFYLNGSFNYTQNGIMQLDEVATLFIDREYISRQLIEYPNLYGREGETH